MTTFTDKAILVFEDAYLKVVSIPTVDLTPAALKERAEQIHDLSLRIMKMENANLYELQAAYALEKAKMDEALEALEDAASANSDYLTLLHSVDYALGIMNNFFLMLM